MPFHQQFDAVRNRTGACSQRRSREAAGISAFHLGIDESKIFNQLWQQTARQVWRWKLPKNIDGVAPVVELLFLRRGFSPTRVEIIIVSVVLLRSGVAVGSVIVFRFAGTQHATTHDDK